ncbi:hypothetical protein [Nostoc sp. LPT]|nr:hypothetical protein [Nostoc sp. LPT]MBN4005178.1 hypothetical protein [Nostoc sp. LPT]
MFAVGDGLSPEADLKQIIHIAIANEAENPIPALSVTNDFNLLAIVLKLR